VADVSTALFVIDEQASLSGSVAAAALLLRRPLWRRIAITDDWRRAGRRRRRHRGVVRDATADRYRLVSSVSRIAPSGTTALTINGIDRDLRSRRTGSRLIYVGNRGTQLFVRALEPSNPWRVTGAPRGPFVSPDGQWIGFVDAQR